MRVRGGRAGKEQEGSHTGKLAGVSFIKHTLFASIHARPASPFRDSADDLRLSQRRALLPPPPLWLTRGHQQKTSSPLTFCAVKLGPLGGEEATSSG